LTSQKCWRPAFLAGKLGRQASMVRRQAGLAGQQVFQESRAGRTSGLVGK
jgi:hypothetical protein